LRNLLLADIISFIRLSEELILRLSSNIQEMRNNARKIFEKRRFLKEGEQEGKDL